MKEQELKECLRVYRSAVGAYERLAVHLGEAPSIAADLCCVGDALARLPEVVEEHRAIKRLNEAFRRQAEGKGFHLRYDKPANDP